MKNREWHRPYDIKPESAELKVPIEYSFSFDWGSLHVSETAHRAYGLIPLTARTQPGFVQETVSEELPQTRVLLITTAEGMPSVDKTAVAIKPIASELGMEYYAAFGGDKYSTAKLVVDSVKADVQESYGMDAEDISNTVITMGGIPLEERAEQYAPQELVHGLCNILSSSVASGTHDWTHSYINRRFYNDMHKKGAFTLLAAGAVLTLPGVVDTIDPVSSEIMAFSLIAIQGKSISNTFKQYLVNANTREDSIAASAERHANAVTADIHELYCTDNFDKQLRDRSLGDQ